MAELLFSCLVLSWFVQTLTSALPRLRSTDESATEAILKAMQSLAQLSGRLELTTPRDAFITAACKASLPPHYTLTVLNPQRSPSHGPQPPSAAAPRPRRRRRRPGRPVPAAGGGGGYCSAHRLTTHRLVKHGLKEVSLCICVTGWVSE